VIPDQVSGGFSLFCTKCGGALKAQANFCPKCGAARPVASAEPISATAAPAATAAPTAPPGPWSAQAPPSSAASIGAPGYWATPAPKAPAVAVPLTVTEYVSGGATFLVFISLFLPWFHVDIGDGYSYSGNAFSDSHGFIVLTLILSLAIVAYLGLRALAVLKLPDTLPISRYALLVIATSVNGVLVLLGFALKTSGLAWSFGAVLGLLAAIGAVVGAAIPSELPAAKSFVPSPVVGDPNYAANPPPAAYQPAPQASQAVATEPDAMPDEVSLPVAEESITAFEPPSPAPPVIASEPLAPSPWAPVTSEISEEELSVPVSQDETSFVAAVPVEQLPATTCTACGALIMPPGKFCTECGTPIQ
jgi:uncharacterized OB-fold protein